MPDDLVMAKFVEAIDAALEAVPNTSDYNLAMHYVLLNRAALCLIGTPDTAEQEEHLITVLEVVHEALRAIGHPTVAPTQMAARCMASALNQTSNDDPLRYRHGIIEVFKTIGDYSRQRLDYTDDELINQQRAFASGMPRAWRKK